MEDAETSKNRSENQADRYQRLVKESNDVATIIDTDGTITYVSPAVTRVLGYDPEELVGSTGYEYVHPDDQERNADAVEAVVETPDEPQTVELRFKHADSTWCWIEATMRNRLEGDVIEGILLNSRKITERKQQEEEYRELAEEYDALLETFGDAIFFAGVDTTDNDPEFRSQSRIRDADWDHDRRSSREDPTRGIRRRARGGTGIELSALCHAAEADLIPRRVAAR